VPLERFRREQPCLIPTGAHPSFLLEARVSRIVASDYLVSFRTNRYSVPFTLIGQGVEVQPREGLLEIFHRDHLVARHLLLAGQHQLAILPEHGPGALPRNARRRFAELSGSGITSLHAPVEVRDLAIYEQLAEVRS
jgi:hypothetical protein